jgi:SAM-dependent methyltransferase
MTVTSLDQVTRTDPSVNLVGTVGRLCLADRSIAVHDLYDREGGAFYDAFAFAGYDTSTAVALADETGGPVLDLACGSGRIGLAIARRGHGVVGLDLSAAMLERFTARLDREPHDVAARVELVHGDFHSLDLTSRFRLAVLGATTIVLVAPAQRRAFFERVRSQLVPGGTFAVDVAPWDVSEIARRPERLSAVEVEIGGGTAAFALCSQHFDVRRRRERVSFFVEEVDGAGVRRRVALTTQKAIITVAEVVADLEAAGFSVARRDAAGPLCEIYEWLVATAPGGHAR